MSDQRPLRQQRVAGARRKWGGRLAVVLGFAMLPGLLTPVSFAATPNPLGRPELSAPSTVKVSPFTAKAKAKSEARRVKDEKALRADRRRAQTDQARTVAWPKAGAAQLTLPTSGTAAATPGALPVTLSAPAPSKGRQAARAASVTVKVLNQKASQAVGLKGVLLTATAPAAGGTARLGIDYSAFGSAYGGDWAGRLQVAQMPACALTTPDKAACRTLTPLHFTNERRHEQLQADLTFKSAGTSAGTTGQTMLLALAATSASGAGDHKATPLAASSTWEAGGSSGSFTWSYPLRVPPAAAGPAPDLTISYDSGSVDGRTASTNNQGTWIGEGFDLTSSYIERKYGSCDDDGQDGKYDLCWKYENASLVLNGKATELVKDDTSGKWRLKNDDASTVTHSTGAENGDDDGEYWTVTTGNGTKYVFGLNKLDGAGATDRTESVWTVPVYGDDQGEPGYSSDTSFSGRSKQQAWRWNLDYVVDTHDNAMTYWYAADDNYYLKAGTTSTKYTRGGYLKEIRYGQRADKLFSAVPAASDKVVFTPSERCETSCSELTDSTRDHWPDVPFDAICSSGDACTGNVGPTFFTRKRLTAITTYFWDKTLATPAYAPVDAWALTQTYLDPGDTGDASDQSLWLSQIRHTGKRGTDIALDPVTFTHTWMTNRVDGNADDILPLTRPRIKKIVSETGAETQVTYMDPGCLAGQTRPAPDQNTSRCYPVYWSPNGGPTPQLDWFQKYPVSSVETLDTTGGSQSVIHTYSYSGGGAWHYNDDPMTPQKERTWSIWRGFEKVTHLTGPTGGTQSKTVTVYLRGMNGDRVLGSDGKTLDPDKRKSVTVSGIKAAELTDSEQYAGFTRESVTYDGANEVSGSVNDPWSQRTATQHKAYADTEAYYVRTGATHGRTRITSAVTPYDRVRTTVTSYDDYGMPITVDDKGDDSLTGDETCTRTWYARNDTKGINSPVSRTRVVSKACGVDDAQLDLPADSTRPGDVISDTATAYDTTTWTESQTPTQGEARWTGRVKGYTTADAPIWQKMGTVDYDDLGRPTTVRDTNDATKLTTEYDPVASGPLTATKVSDAKTYATNTTIDPAWGSPLTITDPNSSLTESTYDSLGRVTATWLPNSSRAGSKPANYIYTYKVTSSDVSWVSTATLKGDATGYNTTYEFFDAVLRSRQIQTPTPVGGRLIAQTLYDARGLAVTTQGDIYDNTSAPSSTMGQIDAGQAPIQTDTTYDGAGRATQVATKTGTTPLWTTTSTYTGDTVTTTAPEGGQAAAVVTNALGQTTQRREYDAPQAAGAHFTTTNFTYTPGGQAKTTIGPDTATWSYTYDLFGRQITANDPDKGETDTAYNELDQAISISDALVLAGDASRKLIYEYDELGRKTKQWTGSKTDATLAAAWTYDSVKKGQITDATRYVGGLTGQAYTSKVTAYDSMYHVTGNQVLLPAEDPLVKAGVPSTLAFTTAYRLDGTISQHREPAVAGLATEPMTLTYNATGQQLGLKGTTGYLVAATYSPQGDRKQLTLGLASTPGKYAYLNNEYEPGTRRLARSYVTDDIHGYMPQELRFKQDDAGNVRSIFDATTLGGTGKSDNQCFLYDGNRRMTEAWTPTTADCADSGRTTTNLGGAAPYWNSYTYKDSGLRDTSTVHTATSNTTTTYAYGTPNGQPHALSTTTVGSTTTGTYAYDKTGNTTGRPGTQAAQTLTWNAESKLATSSEPAVGSKPATGTSYLYDANGTLLIRRPTTIDGETVLYLGATEVHLKTTSGGTTKTLTGNRYYTAAGQTIAVRTATPSSNTVTFLAGDHHSTMSLALDATTLAITKRYSTPFGASRGTSATTWPDDKAFLGAPADTTTGLTHIGAREYDPAVGRFLSVDPVLDTAAAQSLNGYAYANNSPATYSDPTGLDYGCGAGTGACIPQNDGTNSNVSTDKDAKPGTNGGLDSVPVAVDHPYSHTTLGDPLPDSCGDRCGLYGPQPGGVGGFIRWMLEGNICNPGYPCEAVEINELVVPAVPEGPLLGGCKCGRGIAAGGLNAVEAEALGAALTGTTVKSRLGEKYETPETGLLSKLINPQKGMANCRGCSLALDRLLSGKGVPSPRGIRGWMERGGLDTIEANYPGRKFRDMSFYWVIRTVRQAGPGARGIVFGADKRGGHVFNVVNQDGRVVFLDAQIPQGAQHAATWDSYQFLRTD
ncbi:MULTISPECIES: RHS repeat-associated core domain-containing protein [unclassified Streptomyces]|uniref:RHS repeat-associated core domain-containing protein n=1 Tax=unclassified Streptomyces TaxID=2593676 RepID=UPI0003A463BC|nr:MULTISPECIES: RHS repeat-associated core domain-containing protein [unclassified Streptomyces]MYX37827.1 RHS repeat-associated core domain-containing protein [Streptomyces sp. SID8377]